MTPQLTYSYNPSYSTVENGKPKFTQQDEQDFFFAKFNGGFRTVTKNPDELLSHIRLGYATSSALRVPYRHQRNFLSTQILQLDFDKEITRVELEEAYRDIAYAMYTTPSHTSQIERWRVLFILEKPLTQPDKATLAVKSLMHQSGQRPDRSCSDPSRFFYGMGAGGEMIVYGNILKFSQIAVWVKSYESQKSTQVEREYDGIVLPPSSYTRDIAIRIVNKLGEHIQFANQGDKHNTRLWMSFTAGGYGQYLKKQEALNILMIYAMRNTHLSEQAVHKVLSDGWELGSNYPIPIVEQTLNLESPEPTLVNADSYWLGFADGFKAGLDAFGIGHDGSDWLIPLRPHGSNVVANTEILKSTDRQYTTRVAAPFTPEGQGYNAHIICPTPQDALAGLQAYPDLKITWSSLPDLNQVSPPNIEHWPPLHRTAILLNPSDSYRLGELSNAKRVVRTPGKVSDMVQAWTQDEFMSLIRN